MKMKRLLLTIGVSALSISVLADTYTGAFLVAKRGEIPACTISIPGKPDECVRYAAEELQRYTEKMTGVKLPIAERVPSGRSIVLTVAPDGELGRDAFRIAETGGRLVVTGGSASGVLYGIYELLENYGGCRWYASWCERIPACETFEIPAEASVSQSPAFDMREPFWYDMLKHPDFAARNRVNGGIWQNMAGTKHGGTPYRFGKGLQASHTFESLCPQKLYFKDHPEYYSEVNGKRLGGRTQLCLTNPDVLRIVTSNVLVRIRADPTATFFGVSQNDWFNFCTCPKCKAIDDAEESHAGTLIWFINQVAEIVEKEFPQAIVETLAYQYTRKPPKNLKPRANVMPCLCTIECDFSLPIAQSPYKSNRSFLRDIEGWGKISRQIFIWDYTTDFEHFLLPFPNVLALQDNVKLFRDHRVPYLFEQGDYRGRHGDFAELKAWLLAKWMWNPERNREELLADFFNGYYGAAAPDVRTYFDELHTLVRDQEDSPLGCFSDPFRKGFTDEFFDRAEALWNRAVKAVEGADETTRYNVRMGRMSVLYAKLIRRSEGRLLAWMAGADSDRAKRHVDSIRTAKEFVALVDEAKDVWFCESTKKHKERYDGWKELAAQPLAIPQPVTRAVIEDADLKLVMDGNWCERVKDPLAQDGWAVRLNNTHYQWCLFLPLSRIAFDDDATYTLRVRARVDRKPGEKGMAFWTGVHNYSENRGRGSIEPKVEDLGDGYAWYKVLTWKPRQGDSFWAGPGIFGRPGQNALPAYNAVYLDAIEITRVAPADGP